MVQVDDSGSVVGLDLWPLGLGGTHDVREVGAGPATGAVPLLLPADLETAASLGRALRADSGTVVPVAFDQVEAR